MTRLFTRDPEVVAPGAVHLPAWLDGDAQRELVDACHRWAAGGRLRAPRLPSRGVMSVQIVCLGWHWYPYRYARTVDDGDGRPVEPFPDHLGELSRRAVDDAHAVDGSISDGAADGLAGYRPDVALVNWYGPGARMGMHADREEKALAPVVSLSLGDTCVFRFGNPGGRGRPWTDVLLESGDLFVFGGVSRLAYHGVPRVIPSTAPPWLGLGAGRFNVTVRETGLTDDSG
jgi:DNA oxidative demethylase